MIIYVYSYTFNVVTITPGGPPNVCDFDIRFEPNSLTASAALQITNVAEPELNHVITQNIVFMPLSVALPPGSECIWQDYTPENINVSSYMNVEAFYQMIYDCKFIKVQMF